LKAPLVVLKDEKAVWIDVDDATCSNVPYHFNSYTLPDDVRTLFPSVSYGFKSLILQNLIIGFEVFQEGLEESPP